MNIFEKRREKENDCFFFRCQARERKMNIFHRQKKMNVFHQQKKKNDCFQATEEKKLNVFNRQKRK